MQKILYRFAVGALVMVLLVMTAGSIVRMTGSGMGCPDWPRCFGYYIPPTSIETLKWQPNRNFSKGNIIIQDERLLVAKGDFVSGDTLNLAQWEPYTKHDYAHFDPVHTWIEFLNRLIGVLAGIPALVLLVLSIFYLRNNWHVFALAFTGICLLGFAAWLGKLVVDGNLIPHSITYHMFSALALVLVYVAMIVKLITIKNTFTPLRNKRIILIGFVSILLLLIQIGLGTGVREQIDTISQSGIDDRSLWVQSLDTLFLVHRSFSLLVLAGLGVFALLIIQTQAISSWPRILLAILFLEVLAGVGLAYLDMPAALQPVHLVLAALNFAISSYVLLFYIRYTSMAAPEVIG
jgi:cytochrome c oxidase assembly protein subunit 15